MTQPAFTSDASRWAAVSSRNPAADGCFVYCVKTTGIFCRPVCHARLARRSNVEFFGNAIQAEDAGYRACKRCRPTLKDFVPSAQKMIHKIIHILDQLPQDAVVPSLEFLAREAGMTKYHFHRSFKKMTGRTPRDYALAKQQQQKAVVNLEADTVQTSTPSSNDPSPVHGTAATLADGLGQHDNWLEWDLPELNSMISLEDFDWQGIPTVEVDAYLDTYAGRDCLDWSA